MNIPAAHSFVVPGQNICISDEQHASGNGTYVQGDCIFSSLAGFIKYKKDSQETIVEVTRGAERMIVPSVGAIVTAKITNVKRRYCKCAIYCIEDTVLREPFRGMIRREDVRAKEKDKVEMHKCFRTGDIILARVKSIGTAHSYSLTTSENELGVVMAESEAGGAMIPTSWTEMMCTQTFSKEPRKVAKVVPESFTPKNYKKVKRGFDEQ